jgi:hypothetical protein
VDGDMEALASGLSCLTVGVNGSSSRSSSSYPEYGVSVLVDIRVGELIGYIVVIAINDLLVVQTDFLTRSIHRHVRNQNFRSLHR